MVTKNFHLRTEITFASGSFVCTCECACVMLCTGLLLDYINLGECSRFLASKFCIVWDRSSNIFAEFQMFDHRFESIISIGIVVFVVNAVVIIRNFSTNTRNETSSKQREQPTEIWKSKQIEKRTGDWIRQIENGNDDRKNKLWIKI